MSGIGFGIGIDMDLSGFITHLVKITRGKNKTIQYKATCMKDDDNEDSPTTLYKIVNGEKDYDNHIEISDDESVTICIDGEYYFANIIDIDINGGDLTIECEDNFSDEQIHIQCDLLLGSDECNYEDIFKFSTFDLDGNELEEDDDDWDDEDDEDLENNEDAAFMSRISGEHSTHKTNMKALKFDGIKIATDFDELIAQLIDKGYTLELPPFGSEIKIAKLSGQYEDYSGTCEVSIVSDVDGTVQNLVVCGEDYYAVSCIDMDFDFFREKAEEYEKYGFELIDEEDDDFDEDDIDLIRDGVLNRSLLYRREEDGSDIMVSVSASDDDDELHVSMMFTLGTSNSLIDDEDEEDWNDEDDDDDEDKEKYDETLAFARQHPYFNSCKTVVVDQDIFDQVSLWVKRYANFYNTYCKNEQFIEVINGIIPDFDKEHTLILCVNDLLICMERLGIELEAVSRGGMVFTALLMKLQNQIDIESSFNFHNLTNEDADNAQDSMDDMHKVCKSIKGLNTFFVSTLISSYDPKKANRYIDIMEEIANILVDLYKDWDEDIDLNEDFIDEISDLKV